MDEEIEELFPEEDEIIELEDDNNEEITQNAIETPESSYNTPSFNRPNLFKRNQTNDTSTPEKLKNLNKNRSFPQLGASNFANEGQKEENKVGQAIDKVKTKAASSAITAATGGAINGEAADKLAGLVSDEIIKKYKTRIIIVCSFIACVFLLLVAIIGVASNDESVGKDTYTYVTGDMSEEELVEELKYYGYCDDEQSCKSKGIYKFLDQLKVYYNQYKEECPTNLKINEPCEVTLNTGLIIETMNYYQNSSEAFDTYNDEEASKADQEEGFNIFDFFSNIVNKFKKQKAIDNMIDDVENLTLAQSEYVEETCRYLTEEEREKDLADGKVNNKEDKYKINYYQISYDKYISYLKYGNTSTHPNYQGNPVTKKNEVCEYAQNDYEEIDINE